MVTWPNLD